MCYFFAYRVLLYIFALMENKPTAFLHKTYRLHPEYFERMNKVKEKLGYKTTGAFVRRAIIDAIKRAEETTTPK